MHMSMQRKHTAGKKQRTKLIVLEKSDNNHVLVSHSSSHNLTYACASSPEIVCCVLSLITAKRGQLQSNSLQHHQ